MQENQEKNEKDAESRITEPPAPSPMDSRIEKNVEGENNNNSKEKKNGEEFDLIQEDIKPFKIEETKGNMNPDFSFKLVVVGNSDVGKTCLVNYEIGEEESGQKNRSSTEDNLIFNHSWKNYSILGKTIRLQIWDTRGQETYFELIKNFYRSALCIFLVFALDNEESFEKLNNLYQDIKENSTNENILVLIGNKSDLNENKISKEKIEEFCSKNKIENYYETSAKTGDNVHQLFNNIIIQLYMKFAVPIITSVQNRENEETNNSIKGNNRAYVQNSKCFDCFSCCYQ